MLRVKRFRFTQWLCAITILITITPTIAISQSKKDDFIRIFDGKTFTGWEGDTTIWRIENECLVGEVTPATVLKANTFLLWHGGQTNDFELKLEFHVSEAGNTGINYRSELVRDVPYALKGYQADIDGRNIHTGQNYEERGRGFLAKRGEKAVLEFRQKPIITESVGDPTSLKEHIRINDWNECHIVAKGNRLQHFINGVLMSDVTDNDKTLRRFAGILGLQVHVGPPMKAQYRNIRIKQL